MTNMVNNNNNNKSESPSSHVRVVARIRPLSQTERQRGSKEVVDSLANPAPSSIHSNEPELVQTSGADKRWFELDAVFDGKSTQEQVYTRSGTQQAVCEDIFKGYNATILAYGQTGSGKTFTMGTAASGGINNAEDDCFTNSPGDGMIPRACVDLFRNVRDKCDGNALVELSYLEIYNEEIRDLLAPDTATNTSSARKKSLKIRETLNGEVYVSGLTAVPVKSPAEIGLFMEQASKRRVVASTKMNAVSSRSHAICTLTVSGVIEHSSRGDDDDDDDDDSLDNASSKENMSTPRTAPAASAASSSGTQKFTSKLTLVDLAGSERIKKTGAAGNRRQEGISINKGLFVLGQVVSALSEGGASSNNRKKSFTRKPPYRDSILTRLLQNSLGGNSRTIMVACVSPADYNIDESINTLRYATSARKIQSHATRNIVQQLSPEEAAALQRQNQLLQNQVSELQATVRRLMENEERRRAPSPVASTISMSTDDSASLMSGGSSGHCPDDEEDGDNGKPTVLGAPPAPSGATAAKEIERLEHKVSGLKKELRESRRNLHESANSAVEMPSLKMEVELLKEELTKMRAVQAENAELKQELTQQRADADSARHAASKLSDLLDHLKKLRRDEINKKKEELKIMKKDEAWALFMSTMMEGRMDQMSSLVLDFDLFKNVLQQSKINATSRSSSPNGGEPAEEQRRTSKWFGGGSSHGRNSSPKTPEWDPQARERMIMDHVEYFLTRLMQLSGETKEECASLLEMRSNIVRECKVLQEEIGKDELEEDRLDEGEDREDMLEKLKDVLKSRTPAKAKKVPPPPHMSPIKEKGVIAEVAAGVPGLCEL